MRTMIILFLVLTIGWASHAADGLTWNATIQVTGDSGEGAQLKNNYAQRDMVFGHEMMRAELKYQSGEAFAKALIDLAEQTSSFGNIFYFHAGYNINMPFLKNIIAGSFKTPSGMEWNTHYAKLEVTRRLFYTMMIPKVGAGAMLTGDMGAGLSYDLALYNGTTTGASVGEDSVDRGYAFKLKYDMGEMLHTEFYYNGTSNTDEYAVGAGYDYKLMGLGVTFKSAGFTFMGEYTDAQNIGGNAKNMNLWYAHLGYTLSEKFTFVVRHYMATMENGAAKYETELSNTILGVNYYLNPKARIQLNYIFAGGDKFDTGAGKVFADTGAVTSHNKATYIASTSDANYYLSNALALQFQVMF